MSERDDFERTPPHDIDAEQCVLGGMLLSKGAIADVAGVITAADHYRPAHQIVHEAILDLHAKGEPADAITVAAELTRRGDIGKIDGAPYLHTLIAAVPVAANAGHYARIVKERSVQRWQIEIGTRLKQAGYDPGSGTELPPGLLDDLADLAGSPRAPGEPSARDRADIESKARAYRIEASARAMLAAESAPAIPASAAGHEFLAQADEEARYRIGSLWPAGGNVVLAAQFKAGKTTMRDNLIRCLCDGSPFLGRFPVAPLAGRLYVIDCEMPRQTARRWLNAQMISRADRFEYLNIRGRVASFNILVPEIRARWAQRLADAGTSGLILDCIGPVLAALGLDENKPEAGRFLSAFEELLAAAGVTESLIIHHMGHDAERSRGISRLRDWPDAEWRLVRQKQEPASPRYLSAYGRDVDFPESRLDYDSETRHLAIGGGSRRTEDTAEARAALAGLLAGEPDRSANQIEKSLGDDHKRAAIRDALAAAVKEGQVLTKPGPRGARLHYLNPEFADLAGPRQDLNGEVGGTSPITLVVGEVPPTANGQASSLPETANSSDAWPDDSIGAEANR